MGGYLSAGPGATSYDGYWTMRLDLLADPIREPAWREALRALFVRLADELPAFYASAELITGYVWSGRTLWADGDTEQRISPMHYRDGWLGLPPRPTWWTWLGEPFAAYFPHLPAERTTATERGLLYSAADEPSGPADLVPLSTWLPGELFADFAGGAHGLRSAPLVRAPSIPVELRGRRRRWMP